MWEEDTEKVLLCRNLTQYVVVRIIKAANILFWTFAFDYFFSALCGRKGESSMPCTEAYKEHIMYTFNGFCKTAIRFAALNAWRDRSRRRQKEIGSCKGKSSQHSF